MEEFYWSGYVVAFILQIISLLISFTFIFSVRAKNLKHVGLYYSLSHGTFVEGVKPGLLGTILGILFSFFIEPFFSWVSVIFKIYGYIKLLSNKFSAPEKVKEIQFKLGSRLLTKDEVIALVKELAEFQGIKSDLSFNGDEDEVNNIYVLQDKDGWYAEIDIFDKSNHLFAYIAHSPDYDSEWNDIYEYKFEGDTVFNRVLEKKITHPGEEYYDVRDGVILESDIIERLNDNRFTTSDELISQLKDEITWKRVRNLEIKYYLFSKHPEVINTQEFKTILRKDLERIKLLLSKFKSLCKSYSIDFEYNEDNYIRFRKSEEHNAESSIEAFFKELELLEKDENCDRSEIFDSKNTIKIINKYLEP